MLYPPAHPNARRSRRPRVRPGYAGTDDSMDVVSGERFASAITSMAEDGIHRPSVVTFASCDSGNVGSVILPGADLAHALHQAGIPLVVAAQFPLSKEGSSRLAWTLYDGLLWGAHPLVPLQQLRAELHACYTTTFHDWPAWSFTRRCPQRSWISSMRCASTSQNGPWTRRSSGLIWPWPRRNRRGRTWPMPCGRRKPPLSGSR